MVIQTQGLDYPLVTQKRFLRSYLINMNKYFIICVHPTPNGPLHLGHIAGPFLSLDVFAKCKKILKDEVFYISGSDAYENHVSLKSFEENLSEYEVADKYSYKILGDLKLLNIDLDAFVPLHHYEKIYISHCQSIIGKCLASGHTLKKMR